METTAAKSAATIAATTGRRVSAALLRACIWFSLSGVRSAWHVLMRVVAFCRGLLPMLAEDDRDLARSMGKSKVETSDQAQPLTYRKLAGLRPRTAAAAAGAGIGAVAAAAAAAGDGTEAAARSAPRVRRRRRRRSFWAKT